MGYTPNQIKHKLVDIYSRLEWLGPTGGRNMSNLWLCATKPLVLHNRSQILVLIFQRLKDKVLKDKP